MSAIATAKKKITAFAKELVPWLKAFAKMGYVAKGIVYLIIGVMAGLFALGRRNRPGDFSTVLLQSFHEPFGEVLLALLTLGLFGYGVWCLIQAILDTENKGTTIFGIVTRGFYAGVGFVYLAIGWSAIQLLTRTSTVREGDQPEQEWTARVFSISPVTRWFAVSVGLGFLGFCIYEIRRLYVEGAEILRPEGRRGVIDNIAMHIGQIGIVARAALFAIIGFSLIWSGITFDPHKVRGISGALIEVQREPDGRWLLMAIAIGLIAYGIYMLLLAWRRRINPE